MSGAHDPDNGAALLDSSTSGACPRAALHIAEKYAHARDARLSCPPRASTPARARRHAAVYLGCHLTSSYASCLFIGVPITTAPRFDLTQACPGALTSSRVWRRLLPPSIPGACHPRTLARHPSASFSLAGSPSPSPRSPSQLQAPTPCRMVAAAAAAEVAAADLRAAAAPASRSAACESAAASALRAPRAQRLHGASGTSGHAHKSKHECP
jgi:hypothetical protein